MGMIGSRRRGFDLLGPGLLAALLLVALGGCEKKHDPPLNSYLPTELPDDVAEEVAEQSHAGRLTSDIPLVPLPPVDRVAEAEALGIELTPIVGWNGRQSAGPQYPWLNLGVTMRGGAAAEAWQYGGLECRCLLDAAGNELAVVQENSRDYMHLATRESGPAEGVEAWASFERPYPPIESVYAAEGSLRLLLGGELTRVKIEQVASQAGLYRDEQLAALGIEQIEIQYEPNSTASPPHCRLSVLTPRAPIAGIGVVNAQGQEKERTPIAQGFTPDGGANYGFIFSGVLAEDDTLWIDFALEAEIVEVPFRFENIALPEMP